MRNYLVGLSLATMVVLLWCKASFAQPFWTAAGVPGATGPGGSLKALYCSDDGDRLYYGGLRDMQPSVPGWQTALLQYSTTGWDTLIVHGEFYSVVEFHDTLFAGGRFYTDSNFTDTPFVQLVVYRHGDAWHHLGEFDEGDVRSLRVLDDTLYAVGSFTEVDGQPCTGMIRLVNGHWETLPSLPEPEPSGDIITDIIKFQGHLIAAGGIYIGDQDGIAYLDGDQWHILGPGLEAGFSSVRCMTIYQDDLYVGGQIAITPNNPGRDIMRWDGEQFHRLGEVGLQYDLGDDSWFSTVYGMTVHDDMLYVGGGFRFAGGLSSMGVAAWDGTTWCSVPGQLSGGQGHSGGKGLAFFQDTLFVICGYLADGDSVRFAAKFIGESLIDSCSAPVGINEITIPTPPLATFTDAGAILLRGLTQRATDLELFDVNGRLVSTGTLIPAPDGTGRWEVVDTPLGAYVLRIGVVCIPIVRY